MGVRLCSDCGWGGPPWACVMNPALLALSRALVLLPERLAQGARQRDSEVAGWLAWVPRAQLEAPMPAGLRVSSWSLGVIFAGCPQALLHQGQNEPHEF